MYQREHDYIKRAGADQGGYLFGYWSPAPALLIIEYIKKEGIIMKKKIGIIGLLLLLVVFGTWAAAAGNLVDQRGVLSGKVLSDKLVSVGTAVREGDVLVRVATLTGAAPAVRANTDGIVREVLVTPGKNINSGDVLVRLETR
ncbi:MAG: biotin-requiring enzyme [Pelosinus sp.]|nr:biotin-requiring enzyme [Pelosinus sp.]